MSAPGGLFRQPMRWLPNLLLGIFGVAAGLGLGEIAASRILARPPGKIVSPAAFADPYKMRNSTKFRDFDYPAGKPPGVFRILAAGDSFTQGGGVNGDDTWPKKLERYLNSLAPAPPGTIFQVINIGVPGSSTRDQVPLIREEASRYTPDLVILGYCLNDTEDPDDRTGFRDARRRLYLYNFDKGKGLKGYLHDHSALWRLIARRLFNARTFRGQEEYYHWLYREQYPGLAKTRQALLDLGDWSRSGGVPAVVVIFPLLSFGLGDDYPFGYVHEKLGRAVAAARLRSIDLWGSLRDRDPLAMQAIPFQDPHPSDTAQRVAAETILTWLTEQGLVPPGPDSPARPIPSPYR
jgi:lysophospholipase L1-like esterase